MSRAPRALIAAISFDLVVAAEDVLERRQTLSPTVQSARRGHA
jgi:hypothetical protein